MKYDKKARKTLSGTYTELTMPTKMHELSTKAIKYYSSSCTKKAANYSVGMFNSTNAQLLDAIFNGYTFTYKGTKYSFKDTGMDTFSSEWRHFQDTSTYKTMKAKDSDGFSFQVCKCMSKAS
ncbi:MAG: hypothetical protein LUE12_03565 [Ruminococcus sp.]|nr:hypothetical protein [Ruminococcus sp.]